MEKRKRQRRETRLPLFCFDLAEAFNGFAL
jgi:hypothetical protein